MEFISERTSVVKTEEQLSIVITAASDKRKNKLMLAWLLLWTVCGLAIIISFFQLSDSNMKLMTGIWLAFWFYFEVTIFKAWRWRRFGKEVIKMHEGQLSMKRDIRGRGWTYHFDLDEVKNLRPFEDKTPKWVKRFGEDYWTLGGESIVFDHEGKEVRLGYQLTPKELQEVLRLLRNFQKTAQKPKKKEKKEA